MSRSQRLRLADIRRVHELVERVRIAGPNPNLWRTEALTGLIELLHARVGLTTDMENVLPGSVPRPIAPIDLGWNDESVRQRYYEYHRSGESAADPGMLALMDLHQRTRFPTWTRRQFVDDRSWYASPSVSEARHMGGIDDFVCSTLMLGAGTLQGFILYRPWGDQPFDQRDRRMLRLFHAHILRINRNHLPHASLPAGNGGVASHALSPRLRQILELLVAGLGVKQIARRLDISPHTVNDHMKSLYKRLDVSSRAELMSRFVRPDWAGPDKTID